MIASAHVAAGALAGMVASRFRLHPLAGALAAFGLGAISHYALDALPHGDYGEMPVLSTAPIVAVELLVMAVVLARVLESRVGSGWAPPLCAGLAGACLPDAKFVARLVLSPERAEVIARIGDRIHEPFHAGPSSLAIGVTIEVVATLVTLAALTAFPRRADAARRASA
jgi:hypothetical protein